MAGKKNYELEILISGGTDASLSASIRKARKELDTLEQKAGISAKNVNDSFGGMSVKGIDALGSASDRFFSTMVKGSKLAAAGTAALLSASTAVGMGFEAQMSTVQAISQASGADMEKLNALAKNMGETTQFSAQEAGQALEYMAMAGWKTQDMMQGLPGVMYLAAASGEDLGTVSDIVTDAMTAFGLQADQSAHFADVLAQASSNSNTNVAMMGNTFQYVAPVAGAFGYSIEDVAIATGLMANAGIKAEKSGTALRALLTNLAKPTKQVRGYMEELSLSLADSSGKMKPFRQLLEEMRQKFAGLTEAQKAEYAAGIAGKEGMSGLLAILAASDKDFDNLARSIDNSTGAAKKMSEVRLDNLKGDLTLLESAAQGAGIELYEGFSGGLRSLTKESTDYITSFTGQIRKDMPTVQRELKEFGTAAKAGFQPVLDFGVWCLKHPDAVKGTLAGMTAAFGTFKAVQAAQKGVALLGKLSGMLSAWPVAAAGLAIGGITGIAVAIRSAQKEAAKANLDKHFGTITLSIKELETAARHIVSGGGTLFDQISSLGSASDEVQQLMTSLQSGLEDIRKADWKLSMGFTFSEDDKQSYIDSVNAYVKNAQDYITSSGYEVKLAVGIVFGEDTESGNTFSKDTDAFYQSLYQQLEPLEKSLQEVMTDITENGLDLPKQQLVDQYLGQISDITSMITEAQNAAKMQMIENQYAGADLLSGDTFQNLQQSINEYTDEATKNIDESYQKILTSLNAQRLAGEKGMDGGISQAEFDSKSTEALQAYYGQQAEVIANGYQMMKDTIMSAYGDEIQPALDAITQQIETELPNVMAENSTPGQFADAFYNLFTDTVNSSSMAADAKKAVKMLLENMMPAEEDLEQLKQQMEASGLSPGSIITDALNDMAQMSAVTGDKTSIWKLIGDKIADNEDYSLLTETIEQQTGMIPDVAIEAITSRNPDVEAAAKSILETIKDTFAGGVQAEIPITLDTVTTYRTGGLTGTVRQPIEHHAKGGLMESPTLSWFAEESPEMAIPLNGSDRSLRLWQETGQALGAYKEVDYDQMYSTFTTGNAQQDNSTFSPVYSPVIQITPGSSVSEQVMEGLKISYEQFVEYMERFKREQYRTAF